MSRFPIDIPILDYVSCLVPILIAIGMLLLSLIFAAPFCLLMYATLIYLLTGEQPLFIQDEQELEVFMSYISLFFNDLLALDSEATLSALSDFVLPSDDEDQEGRFQNIGYCCRRMSSSNSSSSCHFRKRRTKKIVKRKRPQCAPILGRYPFDDYSSSSSDDDETFIAEKRKQHVGRPPSRKRTRESIAFTREILSICCRQEHLGLEEESVSEESTPMCSSDEEFTLPIQDTSDVLFDAQVNVEEDESLPYGIQEMGEDSGSEEEKEEEMD